MKKFILLVLPVYSLLHAALPPGTTPLMIACTKDNAESFFDLIVTSTNLKLNTQNSLGQTALLCTIAANKPLYTAVLLEMGADPKIADNQGQDAFKLALKQVNSDLYSILAYWID